MSPARAASAALVLVATAVAAPALAQVGARTLVVYPVAAAGATGADANDVSLLLDAALHRVVQRSEEVVLAEPLVTRATCGPAPSAPPQCLAGLSGGGLALRVTVHRSQSTIVVQLEAVDAKARSFGPVTVSVDAFAQSAEPLVHGILMLVEQVAAASRKPDLRTIPLPPPPVLAKPAPPPAAPRAWMRTAGPWLTGTGAALLAGGVALTAMNRSLSNELERKFS
ncbi:MAG TPA: hypothetical protein VIW03_15105, partial [Anaeromyxobacter sp.]